MVDSDILKSLPGKMRFKYLRLLPFQNIFNTLPCLPQIAGIEISLLIQNFGMAQFHIIPGLSRHPDRYPAYHILSEIKNQIAVRCTEQMFWSHSLLSSHKYPVHGDKRINRLVRLCNRRPFLPCLLRKSCIPNLSMVNLRVYGRRITPLPAPVRHDPPFSAIPVPDHQHCIKTGRMTVNSPQMNPASQIPLVPSRSHMSTDRVFPFRERIFHIVHLEKKPFRIFRPARCQQTIPRPDSIDRDLINPMRSCKEICRINLSH